MRSPTHLLPSSYQGTNCAILSSRLSYCQFLPGMEKADDTIPGHQTGPHCFTSPLKCTYGSCHTGPVQWHRGLITVPVIHQVSSESYPREET